VWQLLPLVAALSHHHILLLLLPLLLLLLLLLSLLLLLQLQGSTQAAADIMLIMNTMSHRLSTPLPFWKVLPDRPFNAATKRFNALAAQLIAQEKAKLADAGGGTSTTSSSVKDSCLLTQLVQCDASDTAAAGGGASEVSRNTLSSEEVCTAGYECYECFYLLAITVGGRTV
jgi:hypothetical protein